MKIIYLIIQLSLFLIFYGCTQRADIAHHNKSNPDKARGQFLESVESAIKSNSPEQYLALHNLEGTDQEYVASINSIFLELSKSTIKSIGFTELSADYKSKFITDEAAYEANLKPIGNLKIEYISTENKPSNRVNSISSPYGIKDNKYLFVGVVRKALTNKSPKHVTLSISVSSHPSDIKQQYDGFCKYVENNTIATKKIAGTSPMSYGFWGERITYCEVKKISENGHLDLTVMQNGEIIFESSTENINNIIVYKPN